MVLYYGHTLSQSLELMYISLLPLVFPEPLPLF